MEDLQTLNSLLEVLKEKNPKVIVVTGPQRSMTTITSRIIASELHYEYYDEVSFGIHDCSKLAEKFSLDAIVIQAPGAFHCLMSMTVPDHVFVICTVRSVVDIVSSEKRVVYLHEVKERERVGDTSTLPLSQVKYHQWFGFLKHKIENSFSLDTSTMKDHKMFVKKEDRKEFKLRQWK